MQKGLGDTRYHVKVRGIRLSEPDTLIQVGATLTAISGSIGYIFYHPHAALGRDDEKLYAFNAKELCEVLRQLRTGSVVNKAIVVYPLVVGEPLSQQEVDTVVYDFITENFDKYEMTLIKKS